MPPTKNQFQKVVLSWLTSCCRAGAGFCQSCCPWPEVVAPCAARNASTPLHCSLSWSKKKQRVVLYSCRHFCPDKTYTLHLMLLHSSIDFLFSLIILPKLCQVDCKLNIYAQSFPGLQRTIWEKIKWENISKNLTFLFHRNHQTRVLVDRWSVAVWSGAESRCPSRCLEEGELREGERCWCQRVGLDSDLRSGRQPGLRSCWRNVPGQEQNHKINTSNISLYSNRVNPDLLTVSLNSSYSFSERQWCSRSNVLHRLRCLRLYACHWPTVWCSNERTHNASNLKFNNHGSRNVNSGVKNSDVFNAISNRPFAQL